jgi:hypothetical protein
MQIIKRLNAAFCNNGTDRIYVLSLYSFFRPGRYIVGTPLADGYIISTEFSGFAKNAAIQQGDCFPIYGQSLREYMHAVASQHKKRLSCCVSKQVRQNIFS